MGFTSILHFGFTPVSHSLSILIADLGGCESAADPDIPLDEWAGDPMNHFDQLAEPSSNMLSAEFHFLMDEYFSELGCAPPIRRLVTMPAMMAVALLTKAILLKRPIEDFSPAPHD